MLIETTKLQTVSNYAKAKNLSRQHVYRLIENEEINGVEIDGVRFVIHDKKSKKFQRKRR